jgi:hypothetical protein
MENTGCAHYKSKLINNVMNNRESYETLDTLRQVQTAVAGYWTSSSQARSHNISLAGGGGGGGSDLEATYSLCLILKIML